MYLITNLISILFFQRPVPLAEVKVSQPKFDLAATNFPPLPGCVVSTQGEPVLENRMSDVVRGLYREKVRNWKFSRLYIIWICCTALGLKFMSLCFLQTEHTNKEATVSSSSSQAAVTEEAVAVSSPALAAPKSATQPLGSSAPGYDFLHNYKSRFWVLK